MFVLCDTRNSFLTYVEMLPSMTLFPSSSVGQPHGHVSIEFVGLRNRLAHSSIHVLAFVVLGNSQQFALWSGQLVIAATSLWLDPAT